MVSSVTQCAYHSFTQNAIESVEVAWYSDKHGLCYGDTTFTSTLTQIPRRLTQLERDGTSSALNSTLGALLPRAFPMIAFRN